jgi:putative methyltransferase (TIGR04325 family)
MSGIFLRKIGKRIMPPILVDAVKVLSRDRLYATWEEAEAQCGDNYNSLFINEFRVERDLQTKRKLSVPYWQSNAVRLVAILLNKESIEITDFGGACGAEGRAVLTLLPRARYSVVENPVLVELARARLAHTGIAFTTDIPAACDVFFTSGALQCVARPREIIERGFASARLSCIFSRNNFSDKHLIRVQRSKLFHNGEGDIPPGYEDAYVSYPNQTIREGDILHAAAAHGFELVCRTPDDTGVLKYRDWVYGGQLVFVKSNISGDKTFQK